MALEGHEAPTDHVEVKGDRLELVAADRLKLTAA
jgi:hypothetical protein